jgi:hypothetical protein
MGLNHEHQMPDELQGVVRRLQEDRARLEPLQLDTVKTRALAQARAPRQKGQILRGRIVVSLLALGLMGAGAGGVVAAGGGDASGAPSASSQYQPAKCHTDQAGNVKGCNCPDHSVLVSNGGQFQCQCPDGSSFSSKGNSCKCPDGMKFDNKTDSCVAKGKGEKPCHDHCSSMDDNTQCHDHCSGTDDTTCHDHCTGNPPSCHDHCDSPDNGHADAGTTVYARLTTHSQGLGGSRAAARASRFRGALRV